MGKASRSKKERIKAPTSTSTPGSSRSDRPRWLLPAAGLTLVAIALAVILGLTLGGGSSDNTKQVAATMKAAGCTLRAVKPLPPKNKTNYHADVPSLTAKVKWSTTPPSAGGHWGNWAVWNFYYQAVNPRMVVHNEEHGGMIMWWGSKVSGADIEKMYAFYQEDAVGMVGTPYPALGNKIALTAWTGDPSKYYQDGNYGLGHMAICLHYNAKAFKAFRDAYRGKGPEGIPLSADQPGSGPQ